MHEPTLDSWGLFDPPLNASRRQSWELRSRWIDLILPVPSPVTQTIYECFSALPVAVDSVDQLDEWLIANPPERGTWWRYFVDVDEQPFAMASPIASEMVMSGTVENSVVQLHSVIGAWLFSTSARSADLARAFFDPRNPPVVTAVLARSLMELAGTLWFTTDKVIKGWNRVKSAAVDEPLSAVNEAVWTFGDVLPEWMGSKFTKSKKPGSGSMEPTNAVTLVEKLDKRTDYQFLDAYEWLCNVAHPSLGGTLLYTSTDVEGPQNTYLTTFASDRLIRHADSEGVHSEAEIVREAITGGGMAAFDVIVIAQSHAKSVIDDICLTADVASRTVFNHYRLHQMPDRNQVCPCGSGKKAKHCEHSWDRPTDPLPDRVLDPKDLDIIYQRADAVRINVAERPPTKTEPGIEP